MADAPSAPPAPPRTDASPVTRREIFGWCMYDVADSAFTTVMVTTLFAPYFSKVVVGNSGRADFLWGLIASISELVVAALAPILGAIADHSGSRKKFLMGCGVMIVVFTASLSMTGPGTIGLCMVLFVLANTGFAGGGVFIDSFLPGISTAENAGRLSGIKWALGYLSGLVSLGLCYPLAKSIVENPSPEQLAHARLIPIVVAVYYSVAVLPTFFFLRDRSVKKPLPPGEGYVTVGFRQLSHTLKHIRRYKDLFRLLLAFLVYNDGIVTVISFASLYATNTVRMTTSEVVVLLIVLNVVAAVGAFSFGALADRIGQKTTIAISLVIWIAAVVTAYLTTTKEMFYLVGVLAGLGIGSSQSVTRSLLALFTPKENAAEFFGFLGIAGKALAFLGPIVFGTISQRTGSQRPAILAIGIFFVGGLALLSLVDEKRGKEMAQIPVGG